MEVTAYTKYVRISPKKAREVARVLPGRAADEALELLRFIPRKAAREFRKTLQSAIANAESNHNVSANELVIKEAIVDEGPAFKRFQPVARGSAHPYKKRTSHFRINLTEKAEEPAEATA